MMRMSNFILIIAITLAPVIAIGGNKPLEPIKNIYLCLDADNKKYISYEYTDTCVDYTVPDGWITVMATENNIVDIMPNTIVREKDGVKIWAHFYSAQLNSMGKNDIQYDGMKSISKFYCKKKQTKMIQATYTLGRDVVYERLEDEAIMEEIEPGTVNEKIYEYVCSPFVVTGYQVTAQPPEEFMTAVIYAREGDRPDQSERYGAMSDFIKCLKDSGNSFDWEKTTNAWILNTKKKDSLTKKTTEISWEFVYDKDYGELVGLSRVLIEGVVITETVSVMNNFQSCWEQPTWDTEKKILKAISEAKEIYQEDGLGGLKSEVDVCYDSASYYKPKSNLKLMLLQRCIGIDVFGHVIDNGFTKLMNFPADSFFVKESLRQRTRAFLEYIPQEDLDNILEDLIGYVSEKSGSQ